MSNVDVADSMETQAQEVEYVKAEILKGLGLLPQDMGMCPVCSSDLEQNRVKVCAVCGWQEYPF